MTYDVRVLADASALDLDVTSLAEPLSGLTEALDFGASHLFVDTACKPNPWDPRDCP